VNCFLGLSSYRTENTVNHARKNITNIRSYSSVVINATTVRWLGHLFRTENNIYKFKWYQEGRTKPLRWLKQTFKKSGVNNWKTKAANSMEWRSVVGAVKAGTRL